MEFRKLIEGVADRATTYALVNRGYAPDVYRPGDWFEIEPAEYWSFLEVLPPLDMLGSAFSMSEFSTGNLTDAFYKFGGRFFCLTIERKCRADFELASLRFAEMMKATA